MLEAGNREDQEWLRLECLLFNELLFLFREDVIPWDDVGEKLRKMYVALKLYRRKRGKTYADNALDSWLSLLWAVVRGAVQARMG